MIVPVAFSPDGKFLAAGTTDGYIRVWSIPDFQQAFSYDAHQGWVTEIAYSSDGQILVSGGGDSLVKLWDSGTGQHLKTRCLPSG
jgi:WD40 repeat protein